MGHATAWLRKIINLVADQAQAREHRRVRRALKARGFDELARAIQSAYVCGTFDVWELPWQVRDAFPYLCITSEKEALLNEAVFELEAEAQRGWELAVELDNIFGAGRGRN